MQSPFRNLPALLSKGAQLAEPFSEQSGIVNIVAGAGVGVVVATSIVSRRISGAARVYISHLSLRVVDEAGFDQLQFSLRRNGALISPWESISGEQVVDEHIIPVEQEFGPGLIEIRGTNISGSTLAGAAQAVDIRVIGRFAGWLLR